MQWKRHAVISSPVLPAGIETKMIPTIFILLQIPEPGHKCYCKIKLILANKIYLFMLNSMMKLFIFILK